MLKRDILRLAVLALALFEVGVVRAEEPLNLSTAKANVNRYVDSGDYERDIAAVITEARVWIEARVEAKRTDEKLAIVLDVDETALSNLPYMHATDFGYLPEKWKQWVASGKAPAIKPVLELFRLALRRDVAVFIITGRSESHRPGTERNLEAAGYTGHVRLVCKPDHTKLSTGAFKVEEREALKREGWTIIANIGDQQSDLTGGGAEKTFKLPDPFYLID